MLTQIRQTIDPLRSALLEHPVYQEMRTSAALQRFMEYHIFAVWDFMSLLKALQQHLCCVAVPWIPSANPHHARLINEIVLGEETDEDGQGGYISHFGLYHRSMTQFGASTNAIDQFLSRLARGESVHLALQSGEIPSAIQAFLLQTFATIETSDVCQIASAFTFGRENLLPDVFQMIVTELRSQSGTGLEQFDFYLRRHMQLDSDEHGPMAEQLVESLCGTDAAKWRAAESAAVASLVARLNLWDAIHLAMK